MLTNNHVVDGATSISATDIGNGQTYKATVLGYDRSHDIALIQLSSASGLSTAPLGDSSGLAVGDSIVAVGNAGGVGGTPSAAAGSVTSLGQTITAGSSDGSSEQLSGLIEVNADVQPGDSGGPLVDTSGRVVGVDTAASAGMSFQSASSQGYAVPLNQAMTIVKQIQSGASTATVHVGPTAFLGVEVQSASGQFGGQGAATQSGALVVGLLSGSPAESSGLQAGDTITAIGGQSVESPNALTAQIQSHKPGDKVTLEWMDQSGRQHTADITLAAGPAA